MGNVVTVVNTLDSDTVLYLPGIVDRYSGISERMLLRLDIYIEPDLFLLINNGELLLYHAVERMSVFLTHSHQWPTGYNSIRYLSVCLTVSSHTRPPQRLSTSTASQYYPFLLRDSSADVLCWAWQKKRNQEE